MGIYGLESFMEKNSLTSFENIGSIAKDFLKTTNKTPILLVDFPSCFGHIYRSAQLDKICGGQMKEFVDVFGKLLENFEKHGIKCVFFCDGRPPDEKLGVWESRRRQKIETANATMHAIDTARDIYELKKTQNDFNSASSLPATGAWFCVMNYLRSVEAQLIQTDREADQEITTFLKRKTCFGVLAQDSDFVIAEGILHYFSVKNLNMQTLDTIEYRRDKLAQKLGLKPELLPIFAILSGTDMIHNSILQDFHWKLLGKRGYNRYNLFKAIAAFIIKQSRQVNLLENPEKLAELIGMPELSGKIAANLEDYACPAIASPPDVPTDCDTWKAIVLEAHIRKRHQHQSAKIYSVLVSKVLFSSIYLQYFSNEKYPCDDKVGSTIRRKFYGILLKEHPEKDSIKVTEYVSSGQTGSQFAAPIYPESHPGLLTMWSGKCSDDEKWRLLCWAVGDGVPVDLVRALPEQLQIPTLALFYMKREITSLEAWQGSALALQAVCLLRFTASELRDLQCDCEDAVAVHLATVYQSMCMWVSYVAEACGNPTCLFKFKDYALFDGKLFHSIYVTFKKHGRLGHFFDELNSEEAEFLKQMEVVMHS